MGHIFISYSHKDTKYAHALADHLKSRGFNFWIDERLDYGSQWPYEIQKQLDSCDAFLVIMTPRSFASEWVQSELQRAKRKLKPIFPLLLEGEEPWLSLESTQYFDVRGETFPDTKFFSALQRVMTVDPRAATFNRLPKPVIKTEPPRSNKRTGWIAAFIGGIAIAMCACAAMIGPVINWMNRESVPTDTPQATITSPAIPSPTISEIVMPSPTITLTVQPTATEILPTATVPSPTPIPPTITPTQPIPIENRTDITRVLGYSLYCPVGYAIAGMRIDRNQLLCRRVMRSGEESFVVTAEDTNTARSNMHACPVGKYMRGVDLQLNILYCSHDSRDGTPSEWRSSDERDNTIDIPGSIDYDMHICPASGDQITFLTGLREDENRFLCATLQP